MSPKMMPSVMRSPAVEILFEWPGSILPPKGQKVYPLRKARDRSGKTLTTQLFQGNGPFKDRGTNHTKMKKTMSFW